MSGEKRLKLLCIPPSATSAMMYIKWKNSFGENVEVCPIELPGKGSKFREAMPESLDKITDSILDEAKKAAGGSEYAIFGFCSGAVAAFDLYQKLIRDGFHPPVRFIAASSREPGEQINTPSILESSDETIMNMFKNIFTFRVSNSDNSENYMRDMMSLLNPSEKSAVNSMSDSEILSALNADSEEGRAALESYNRMIGIMKHDSKLLHSYIVPEKIYPFTMPVTIIQGKFDAVIKRRDVEQWKKYCESDFKIKMMNGGHLAVFDNSEEAVRLIKEALE